MIIKRHADQMVKLKFFSEGFYYSWTVIFMVLAACYCPWYPFIIYSINIIYVFWMIDGLWWSIERYLQVKNDRVQRRMFWWDEVDAFFLPLILGLCCVFPLMLNLYGIWYF